MLGSTSSHQRDQLGGLHSLKATAAPRRKKAMKRQRRPERRRMKRRRSLKRPNRWDIMDCTFCLSAALCFTVAWTTACIHLETHFLSGWAWCRGVASPLMDNGNDPTPLTICSTNGWWGKMFYSNRKHKNGIIIYAFWLGSRMLSSSSSSTSNRAIRLMSGPSVGQKLTASTLRNSPGTDSTSGWVAVV